MVRAPDLGAYLLPAGRAAARAHARDADRVFSERSIDGPPVYQSERDDWILAMIAAGMGYEEPSSQAP